MPLPTCECAVGRPIQDQLGFIYCALLEILAASGGGDITLSQISDLDTSWITPLQTPITPFAESLLASNGIANAFVGVDGTGNAVTFFDAVQAAAIVEPLVSITASQISDATAFGLSAITFVGVIDQHLITDGGGLLSNMGFGVTASQTPVTQVDTDRGIVTVLS